MQVLRFKETADFDISTFQKLLSHLTRFKCDNNFLKVEILKSAVSLNRNTCTIAKVNRKILSCNTLL